MFRYQLAALAIYTRSELLMITEANFLAGFVTRYETFVVVLMLPDWSYSGRFKIALLEKI